MSFNRVLKHLFVPHWVALRVFPRPALAKIEQAIKDSERAHRGEIRFAIEAALHLAHLRLSTRARARQVFAQLGVWDTEENSGVAMETAFKAGRYEDGALAAIGSVTGILARHFPAGALNPNELPDKPAVL